MRISTIITELTVIFCFCIFQARVSMRTYDDWDHMTLKFLENFLRKFSCKKLFDYNQNFFIREHIVLSNFLPVAVNDWRNATPVRHDWFVDDRIIKTSLIDILVRHGLSCRLAPRPELGMDFRFSLYWTQTLTWSDIRPVFLCAQFGAGFFHLGHGLDNP